MDVVIFDLDGTLLDSKKTILRCLNTALEEFGRTPFAQGANGRDHNEFGFTMWLAGGGVKPGLTYGATDRWGYKAIENRLEIHDLHATMLHLMGLDHTKLTYRFSGRDIRLTDVRGRVINEILV